MKSHWLHCRFRSHPHTDREQYTSMLPCYTCSDLCSLLCIHSIAAPERKRWLQEGLSKMVSILEDLSNLNLLEMEGRKGMSSIKGLPPDVASLIDSPIGMLH